jgi:hypothetical protein
MLDAEDHIPVTSIISHVARFNISYDRTIILMLSAVSLYQSHLIYITQQPIDLIYFSPLSLSTILVSSGHTIFYPVFSVVAILLSIVYNITCNLILDFLMRKTKQ